MATGYIFTKTGNITKAKHVTNDVVDRVKSISGPVVIENNGSSIIEVVQGGGNIMSFTVAQIVTIDGSNPAGTLEGVLDQLSAVFPDASTTGGGGGGLLLPSMTGKANYEVQTNGSGTNLQYRPKIVVDLRDYTGLDGTFTNDNTSIFQQAINDGLTASRVVELMIPDGHYAIAGALHTDDGLGHDVNTAQIYIPYQASNDDLPRITIRGASKPNWSGTEITIPSSRSNNGVILESTILGPGGVFGAAMDDEDYGGFQYGDFTFTFVDFENLIIRVRSKTGGSEISHSMRAINGRNYIGMTADWVKAEIQSRASDALVAAAGTAGIIFPQHYNRAVSFAGRVYAEGFETGVIINEHFQGTQIIASACKYALGIEGDSPVVHVAQLQNLTAENCKYFVHQMGNVNLKIHEVKGERHRSLFGTSTFEFVQDHLIESGAAGIVDMPRIFVTSPVTNPSTMDTGYTTNDFTKVKLRQIGGIDIDETVQVFMAGAINLDNLLGKKGSLSLTSSTIITAMPNPDIRREFILSATQDATGGYVLSFPGGIYLSDTTPDTTANTTNVYTCRYSGGYWYVTVDHFTTVTAGATSFTKVFTDLSGWVPYQNGGSIAAIDVDAFGTRLRIKSSPSDSGFAYLLNAFTPGDLVDITVVTSSIISGNPKVFLGDIVGGTGSLDIHTIPSAGSTTFSNIDTTGLTAGTLALVSSFVGDPNQGYITSITVTIH